MAHKLGVKGSDVLTSTSNNVLDLSVMLNRGLNQIEIQNALSRIFTYGTYEEKMDAFVLTFQTRDIRGGKGERDLFYYMFNELLSLCPEAATATIPYIPEYGYWKDVFILAASASAPSEAEARAATSTNPFLLLAINQLKKDAANAYVPSYYTEEQRSVAPLSLAAKWAPREHNKKQRAQAILLARKLFPGQPTANEMYRKMIAGINEKLETVEIAMCAQRFSKIDPAKIPGRCRKVHTKAFLNQVTRYRLQPSTDPDRVEGARRYAEHNAKALQGKAKVNGADTVYPY